MMEAGRMLEESEMEVRMNAEERRMERREARRTSVIECVSFIVLNKDKH